MSKEILINCHPRENRVAVLADGKLEQFFLERGESQRPLGNIYKGTVTTILPGLAAAFVSVGLEKEGFLPMRETAQSSSLWEEYADDEDIAPAKNSSLRPVRTIQQLLRKDQEIVVQVVKEPISGKGARLTTQISLPGRYLVLTPREKRIGISRKITTADQRQRLRKLIMELKASEDIGVIVRTAALTATRQNLKRDLHYLLNTWKTVLKQEKNAAAPALLHEELGLVMKVIRESLLTDVEHIVVDSKTEYKKINRFLANFSPQVQSRLVLYRGRKPLFEKHDLDAEIEKLFHPKIWLKCGGFLVFNQTEALVAVDVNSGKHKGGKDQEETALKANLEAAEEVATQLRLRNVGGIIVIDFIDMSSRRYQKRVMTALLKELKKDKAKTRVLPFSEFGLVQLTRQREEESFLMKVYERCPYCRGLGAVKSLFSMGLEIERLLRSGMFRYPKAKRFRIVAAPALARFLLEEGWDQLRRFGHRRGIRISIIDNPELGFQEYVIWALSSTGQERVTRPNEH
ncbi:MAG: Rne/Rng family ribonuclease [PVC group bacterium]